MSKDFNLKESIEILESIIVDNICLDVSNKYIELDNIFTINTLTELTYKNIIEPYKKICCKDCGEHISEVSKKEIELYEFYFKLLYKENKTMQDIMQITSVEQILDLKFKCNVCKEIYSINNTIDVINLLNKEVYKVKL